MIVRDLASLPADLQLRRMPLPRTVLMCPPDHFDVVDEKNPFMKGKQGQIDRRLATAQWEALKDAFDAAGVAVETIAPTPGCEDMVFCANQTIAGLDADGNRVCILSRMRHESRQREVPAFRAWFEANHFEVVESEHPFEGGGDAIWHPGAGLLWGGVGPRSSAEAYELVAETFDVPVVLLELATDDFYHLDTCFCPLDDHTVMVYPPAFTDAGRALIGKMFGRVIAVGEEDARRRFACNATACLGRTIIIEMGSEATNTMLRAFHYEVVEVDTGEFLKSGGSVYCMKQWLF